MGSAYGSPLQNYNLGSLASVPQYPVPQQVQASAPPPPAISRPQVGWSENINSAGPIEWNNRKQVMADWQAANQVEAPRDQWSPRWYGGQDNLDPTGRMGYAMPERDPRSMARPDYTTQNNMYFRDPMMPQQDQGGGRQMIARALNSGKKKRKRGGNTGWRPYSMQPGDKIGWRPK